MANPAATRPGRLRGEEFAYVADAVELDVLDRARDVHRDLDRERLLDDAVDRMRAGIQLSAEQLSPVADVIELDLEDRKGDFDRDHDAEENLARALAALRG